MTVSALCVHDFCARARASAPWKIFCCSLKFLLKNDTNAGSLRFRSPTSTCTGMQTHTPPHRLSSAPPLNHIVPAPQHRVSHANGWVDLWIHPTFSFKPCGRYIDYTLFFKNNTQCCGVVVTPVNLLRASREHLGRGWLVVEHPFGGV